MQINNYLLVPIVGHGATDLIDAPELIIFLNIFTFVFIQNCNLNIRTKLLIGSSIYHISQDIPGKFKYIISSFLHFIWLKKPIIAKLNLLLIHTPLHYYRIYYKKTMWKTKIGLGIFTSILSNIFMKKNLLDFFNKYLGELWWVSPILSHIILTSIINYNYIYNFKKNKFLKLFKTKYIL